MNEHKSDKGHETGDFLLVHFPPCSSLLEIDIRRSSMIVYSTDGVNVHVSSAVVTHVSSPKFEF